MTRVLVAAVAAILVGSLPTRRLTAVLARVAGVQWVAAAGIAIDVLKGVAAVGWIAPAGPWSQCLVATAVLAGHQWPPLAERTGHRGTAVALGALTIITPIAAPLWGVFWGLGFVASGYATLGYVAGALLLAPALGFIAGWPIAAMALPLCVLLLERLRSPLGEVLRGTALKHHWRGEA